MYISFVVRRGSCVRVAERGADVGMDRPAGWYAEKVGAFGCGCSTC